MTGASAESVGAVASAQIFESMWQTGIKEKKQAVRAFFKTVRRPYILVGPTCCLPASMPELGAPQRAVHVADRHAPITSVVEASNASVRDQLPALVTAMPATGMQQTKWWSQKHLVAAAFYAVSLAKQGAGGPPIYFAPTAPSLILSLLSAVSPVVFGIRPAPVTSGLVLEALDIMTKEYTGRKERNTGPEMKHVLGALVGMNPRATTPQEKSVLRTAKHLLGMQVPDKRIARTAAEQWTGAHYDNIQRLRRTGRASDPYTNRLNYTLRTYMKKFSLRAPAMPPKIRNPAGGELQWLYRGITMSRSQFEDVKRAGRLVDRGYMAFSRYRDVAEGFADSYENDSRVGILFRLNVRDVPRGTPWIWYTDPKAAAGRRSAYVASAVPEEEEVVLPPGALVFKTGLVAQRLSYTANLLWTVDVRYSAAALRWKQAGAVARATIAMRRSLVAAQAGAQLSSAGT